MTRAARENSTSHFRRPLRGLRAALMARVTLLILTFVPAVLFAQTAKDKARINYEAARVLMAEGKPRVALEKLQTVIGELGELPDLLLLTAKAAFEAGEVRQAQEFVSRTFKVADDRFRGSDSYQDLVALAAKVEAGRVRLEEEERLQKARAQEEQAKAREAAEDTRWRSQLASLHDRILQSIDAAPPAALPKSVDKTRDLLGKAEFSVNGRLADFYLINPARSESDPSFAMMLANQLDVKLVDGSTLVLYPGEIFANCPGDQTAGSWVTFDPERVREVRVCTQLKRSRLSSLYLSRSYNYSEISRFGVAKEGLKYSCDVYSDYAEVKIRKGDLIGIKSKYLMGRRQQGRVINLSRGTVCGLTWAAESIDKIKVDDTIRVQNWRALAQEVGLD